MAIDRVISAMMIIATTAVMGSVIKSTVEVALFSVNGTDPVTVIVGITQLSSHCSGISSHRI